MVHTYYVLFLNRLCKDYIVVHNIIVQGPKASAGEVSALLKNRAIKCAISLENIRSSIFQLYVTVDDNVCRAPCILFSGVLRVA